MSEVWFETPDAVAASLLRGRLGDDGVEFVTEPGRCELRVAGLHLADLPGVLAKVEEWMADEGIASIAVRLDERSYVLVRGG